MLACVCQPTETALLYKGGPAVAMGPLGTNSRKHQKTADAVTSVKLISKAGECLNNEASSVSLASSPMLLKSTSLLNLRKIERRTKSTKILVNPVCSDGIGSSDDSNHSKKYRSKWNGKKKRLKGHNTIHYKSDDSKSSSDKSSDSNRKNTFDDDKKSTNCFKIRSSSRKIDFVDERRSGKENCTNENCSNWKTIRADGPDILDHSIKNCLDGEIVEKDTPQDHEKDQSVTDKTDRVSAMEVGSEVSESDGRYHAT
ncbi:hypothetical protein EVAR_47810_1, partial [Eumeta japonica]